MNTETRICNSGLWCERYGAANGLRDRCSRILIGPICFYRISLLLGDPSKAEATLKWKRSVDFDSLVREMVEADLASVKNLVEDHN